MTETNGNAAVYFLDRQADAMGEKPAFVEIDGKQRTLSYAALAEQSARMPDLLQRHGVRREERIALLLLDTVEFPVIFWGALKCGVVPVALNTLLSTDIYATILRDCRARALFVSSALVDAVKPLLENHPFIETVFVVGESEHGYNDFAAALAESASTSDTLSLAADEVAFWLYSSGSTGQPKGVRHAHGSLQVTADTYGRQVLGIETDDLVYSAAKFFFAYGLGNALTFPMSVGATTLLLSGRPTPAGVDEILNSHKPTVFCGVPTLYAALLAHLEQSKGRIDAPLRRCISAGEALPEEIGRRWEALTGCEILDGVGSTEMLHIFLSNSPGDVVYGTSGTAVPGYEMRLVDEQGVEVGIGETGELLVSGDSAACDYWNQRDKSRHTFEGVWTRTGDKYERTADGRLIYQGRTDDMFKVSGIWVSPFEVEQALVSHPDVLEAAVVPLRDSDELEKPKAYVVLKHGEPDDSLVDALQAHVKQRIGKWKYPRWVEFVPDLPKTATGKIQRYKLRT